MLAYLAVECEGGWDQAGERWGGEAKYKTGKRLTVWVVFIEVFWESFSLLHGGDWRLYIWARRVLDAGG